MVAPPRLRAPFALLAAFGLGWLAVISRPEDVLGSEMWPLGLCAAALLAGGRRYLVHTSVAVVLIGCASFALGGRSLDYAAVAGPVVLIEALVICSILTDHGRREAALRVDNDFGRFLIALVAGSSVGGILLGMAAWLLTGAPPVLTGLGTMVGHLSSALVWLPFLIRTDGHPALARRPEQVSQWVLVLGVCIAVLLPHDFPSLAFLVLPVLAWTARRNTLVQTQGQLLAVACVATVMTAFGFGPLAEDAGQYELPQYALGIALQLFIIACALIAIPLSLAVGQQLLATARSRRERDVLRRVIDSAQVAIIGSDAEGRINLFNPGAERILGYAADEVVGRPNAALHSARAVSEKAAELGVDDDFATVARSLATPEHAGELMRFLCQDGTERTHAMTLSPIHDARGRVDGFVCTSADVAEETAARQVLLDALDTERRAVERLQEVDQVKDAFVSTVSHELRTPITSIVGYLEMLLEGEFGDLQSPQRAAVRRIDSNSKRLLTLIDELLTLSRIHEREAEVFEELDLREVARTAYDVVAPSWAQRDLTTRIEVPAEPVLVAGSRELLERALVNLLGNAVKFTPDGGRISVEVGTTGDSAEVAVRDSGIGIPLEEQQHLFTRFFRSSLAQRHAFQGSGLGLAIAHGIIEEHGGTLEVVSAPDSGTTVRMRVPLIDPRNVSSSTTVAAGDA